MTAADVLRRGRDLLREKGWTQKAYKNDSGCMCSLGACYVAAGVPVSEEQTHAHTAEEVSAEDRADEAQHFLYRAIREIGGLYGVIDWNDRPERTVEEVYAAFDKAIEIAEGQS